MKYLAGDVLLQPSQTIPEVKSPYVRTHACYACIDKAMTALRDVFIETHGIGAEEGSGT